MMNPRGSADDKGSTLSQYLMALFSGIGALQADKTAPSSAPVVTDVRRTVMPLEELEHHVARQMAEGKTVEQALAEIGNVLSYTAVVSTDAYAERVPMLLSAMQDQGFRLQAVTNDWPQSERLAGKIPGVVSSWRDPQTDSTFEVQFHTLASDATREPVAKMLALRRTPNLDESVTESIDQHVKDLLLAPPTPPGVEDMTLPSPDVHS